MSRTYLPDLAEALDLPRHADGDRIVAAIKLLHPGGRGRPADRDPTPVPSEALVEGWTAALAANRRALRYLRRDRGLTDETIAAARIGYASRGTGLRPAPEVSAFVIPVFERGTLVRVRLRFWPDPAPPLGGSGKPVKIAGLPGHSHVLYPDVPAGRGPLLLCEGEFDALIARHHGLPALTSTGGMHWNPEWNPAVVGRRVAVVYDAGEATLATARKRAAGFVESGAASAWAVDLASLGLADGEDLTDWFVTYGRSAGELRRALNRGRRGSR